MKLLSRSYTKDGEGHARLVAEECEWRAVCAFMGKNRHVHVPEWNAPAARPHFLCLLPPQALNIAGAVHSRTKYPPPAFIFAAEGMWHAHNLIRAVGDRGDGFHIQG